MQDHETDREPVDPQEDMMELNDTFNFSSPDLNQLESCLKVQDACRSLAQLLTSTVPEGRERNIAVNNVLSAALIATHGITRRKVVVVTCVSSSEESKAVQIGANI